MNTKALLACVALVQCIYGLSAAPFLRTPFANVEFPNNFAAPFGFATEALGYGYGPFGTAFGYEGPFGFGAGAFGSEPYNGFAGPFNAPLAYEGFAGNYACGPKAFAFEGFNGPFAYAGSSGPFNVGPFPYTAAIF